MTRKVKNSGFTLVEIIIVSAISVLIFTAVFASFQSSLRLINLSRAKLSAISLANERMEYFRSLPYDSVGTAGGSPSGTIPQNNVLELNGIEFNERILVEYFDAPEDGLNTDDENAIIQDYKRVKLEYSWVMGDTPGELVLISNIVPRSIETTPGGGSVRVNVINANATPLANATVRLINNTTPSPIDTSRVTNSSGIALFSGFPVASDYELIVTANIGGKQYSTAKTYEVTPANPNPILTPFSVLLADVSPLTLQIGELSDRTIATYSNIATGSHREDFSDLTGVATSSKVKSVGGNLVLNEVAGNYESSGYALIGPISPSPLLGWGVVTVAASLPFGTSYKVQFYTNPAPDIYNLIPDLELSGNSFGFVDSIIDISELDPWLFPAVVVGISLETTDISSTPAIDELRLFYTNSKSPLGSVPYDIRGYKVIGTDASNDPIYKFNTTRSTNASGIDLINGLEFDLYELDFSGYDIAQACTDSPFIQNAGEDGTTDILLAGEADHTLRVVVKDVLQRVVPGVSVRLNRPSYNVTQETDLCGQTFFTGGLVNNSDYVVTISSPGYASEVINGQSVDGDSVLPYTILP
jgi:prepilin-type N-terminal cleavage/methylation domain-containing protein